MRDTKVWTTIEVLKELGRMCDSFETCTKCPLSAIKREYECACVIALGKDPKKTIEKIVAWSIKHPEKTFLDDFKEKYPKAPIDDDGTPLSVCPHHLGFEMADVRPCRFESRKCIDCWSRPLE